MSRRFLKASEKTPVLVITSFAGNRRMVSRTGLKQKRFCDKEKLDPCQLQKKK